MDTSATSDPLENLIQKGTFHPVIRQMSGGAGWAARIRLHGNKTVIHFMNTALKAIPHPTLKDVPGVPILKDIESKIVDNNLSYEINTQKVTLSQLAILSPELGEETKTAEIRNVKHGYTTLNVDLTGIKIYAVAQ